MTRLAVLMMLLSQSASAGPWTRDPGHFYVGTSYQRIAAEKLFSPDFNQTPIRRYEQHLVYLYSEVGLVKRWLTASVEGTLYRRGEIRDQGYTEGFGDARLGLWSGLVEKPVRFSVALLVGIPTGDSAPSAGPSADADAQQIARSLPTGDGEWDVEWRASLGYSFGGARRWPLIHYLVAEAGYWLRTNGYADAFTYKLELGVQFPWKFVERFWLMGRLTGVESFATQKQASMGATGLGNGVTYTAYGVELYGRIYRGLGASLGIDSAFRARSLPAAAQLKVGVSYQW
jgi:hypothetical protein